MCEPSRIVLFALCALASAGSAVNGFQRAAAAEITFSVGTVQLSWPRDAGSFHARAVRLEEGFCRTVADLQLVSYSTCRQSLGALLDAAAARGAGGDAQPGLRTVELRNGAEPSARCNRVAGDEAAPQPWYLQL